MTTCACQSHEVKGLVAAVDIPTVPPDEWFVTPMLTGPTPLTIEASGRIYGHLATWGTCHVGYRDQCVEPPISASGYAYFRVGAIETTSGSKVPVGHITMNTGHAPTDRSTSPQAAAAHYDNTGAVVADVAAGEDEFGIWIAGALRSTVTDQQIRALSAAALSGDWRPIRGSLELVAALAVNVPGFPIPRPELLVASGEVQAVTAINLVPHPTLLASPRLETGMETATVHEIAEVPATEPEGIVASINDILPCPHCGEKIIVASTTRSSIDKVEASVVASAEMEELKSQIASLSTILRSMQAAALKEKVAAE